MSLYEILSITKSFFETNFKDVNSKIVSGQLKINHDYSYPTSLRVGETKTQYLIELLGSTTITSNGLYTIKTPRDSEKYTDATDFVNPGIIKAPINPVINLLSSADVSFVTLATPFNETTFKNKVNLNINLSRMNATFDADSLLKIGSNVDKSIFENVDMVQSQDVRLFFKKISLMLIIQKSTNTNDYLEWLKIKWLQRMHEYNRALGMNVGYISDLDKLSVDLMSITSQDASENVIDTFLRNNREVFSRALGYAAAIPQPELRILNNETFGKEDLYLQPDYLLRKTDGTHDILDLKKSLIKQKSIIKGQRKRLRFKDYVLELIAQLDGYKRYFDKPENREWAEANNLRVEENPKIFGIVGNYNNFIKEEVTIALGPYKDNLILMSYSDLIELLRIRRT